MISDASIARYTIGEEIANSVTHGIGALLAVAGLVLLAVFSSLWGTAWHIVSCSIFGSTLVLLYLASTLYHSIPHAGAKRVLQVIDHVAIFLLIAGTYTPFTLVNMRGPWGWALFGIIWGLAAFGIAFQTTLLHRWRVACVPLYIIMGWTALIALKTLIAAVAPGGLLLLLLGGITYTVGVAFYAWQALPYHHAIWHVFVLAGSVLHFLAVLFYVIPIAIIA